MAALAGDWRRDSGSGASARAGRRRRRGDRQPDGTRRQRQIRARRRVQWRLARQSGEGRVADEPCEPVSRRRSRIGPARRSRRNPESGKELWATRKRAACPHGSTRRRIASGWRRRVRTCFVTWIDFILSPTCLRAPARGANGSTSTGAPAARGSISRSSRDRDSLRDGEPLIVRLQLETRREASLVLVIQPGQRRAVAPWLLT